MHVGCINTIAALDRVRPAWEAVQAADPRARLFTSWAWLRGWFETCPRRWFVLTAHPSEQSAPVGLFPLSLDPPPPWYRVDQTTILRLGGDALADYNGLVCHPDHEAEVLAAFAEYIDTRVRWDRFEARDVRDTRIKTLLETLNESRSELHELGGTSCPHVELPDRWERYFDQTLSKHQRSALRREIRRVQELEAYRAEDLDAGNLDRQIALVLSMWRARSSDATADTLRSLEAIFRRCFEAGTLWIRSLWVAQTPLAALAGLLDRKQQTFCYYLGGFNHDYAELSPGTVALADSIRFSIEQGFRWYDFLRGDEDYKFALGALDRLNQNLLVVRRNLRARVRRVLVPIKHRLFGPAPAEPVRPLPTPAGANTN